MLPDETKIKKKVRCDVATDLTQQCLARVEEEKAGVVLALQPRRLIFFEFLHLL